MKIPTPIAIQIGITKVANKFEADELSFLTVVGFGAFAIFCFF
jgi:hypothetical protein